MIPKGGYQSSDKIMRKKRFFQPVRGCPPHGWSFFDNHLRLYSDCRRKPAMAINGRRNKPFGPGGSTRRLHQFQESVISGQ